MEITLKNLLTIGEPIETIYYRCNSPAEDEEDMFYGGIGSSDCFCIV